MDGELYSPPPSPIASVPIPAIAMSPPPPLPPTNTYKILYESDAMSRQKDILGAPPRGEDEKRNKELKQALTRTHFTFGEEPMVYERTSTLPDPTGHLEDYTGVLNTEVCLCAATVGGVGHLCLVHQRLVVSWYLGSQTGVTVLST